MSRLDLEQDLLQEDLGVKIGFCEKQKNCRGKLLKLNSVSLQRGGGI